MITAASVIYCLFAFLAGSVPWSLLIGKAKGVDIREHGSGNTGATNLYRVCGSKAGILGLFLDALKGALPVLAARFGFPGLPAAGEWIVAAAALLAVAGHMFSPWISFRGGKGVATMLGVLIVLSPLTVAAGLVVFVAVVALSRYVSLGSICAAVAVGVSVFIFEPGSLPVQAIVCLAAFLIILRHRTNILRLLKGRENRFSFGKGEDG